jgi:hypothetical protein
MAQGRGEGRMRAKFGRMAGLATVLGVALALRLIGIRWGLPDETHLFSYYPDEFHSLRGAISLALGDLNPHFFNYGSLYLYLVAIAAAISNPTLFAAVATASPGGPVLPEALSRWTLDARIVTVILAVATVAVVYATARRIWGHREGLAAGLLLALAPLHVLHSHYATVDVPGALFTALACYFAVAMLDEASWRNVLWAGAAAGLAASVKYGGGAAIVAPIVAWGIVRARERGTEDGPPWAMLPAMAGAALAAFALTSPYTFLDWPSAWQAISFEMDHMRTGDDPAMLALYPSGWGFQAANLAMAGGYVMLAAAAVGLAGSVAAERREAWPLVAFGVVTFVMIAGAQVRYGRYAAPLLPVVAVLAAGVASDDLLALARGRVQPWLMAVAMALLLGGSVLGAGILDHRLLQGLVTQDARSETRSEALALLEARVPRDGTIGLITEPWFYHPPVDYCNGGVALRGNPLWAAYRRPIRTLAMKGLAVEEVREAEPDAVVLTGFEVAVKRTAGDGQALEFMAGLEEMGYAPIYRPEGLAWWWASRRPPAQDWLYAYPWVEVWAREGGG